MRSLLADYLRLSTGGTAVGRAVVTAVWGSAPEPEGAVLLATADGRMAGSVCGGCVEGTVVADIQEAIRRGEPKLLSYGVSQEKAWSVGLACGGNIKVLVEPEVRPELLPLLRTRIGFVVATILGGRGGPEGLPDGRGGAVIFMDDGREPAALSDGRTLKDSRAVAGGRVDGLAGLIGALRPLADDALARESSRTVELTAPDGPIEVFLEVIPRQPRLIVFGAVHIAAELVPMARRVGFETAVADGREAFLSRDRFPDADHLILGWPHAAFAELGIDRATYICLLSHDPKFDEPALRLALRSPARYIGAIGSKKTQASRRERLLSEGFAEADLARIHGPIGLPIGGRRPAETALAILAEMVKVRYGGRPEGREGGK
jgi:xanthine dehydrogenase accessory factor